jgi:hypothetical protein
VYKCRVTRGNDVGIIIKAKFPHVATYRHMGIDQSNSFNSVEGGRISTIDLFAVLHIIYKLSIAYKFDTHTRHKRSSNIALKDLQ